MGIDFDFVTSEPRTIKYFRLVEKMINRRYLLLLVKIMVLNPNLIGPFFWKLDNIDNERLAVNSETYPFMGRDGHWRNSITTSSTGCHRKF